MNIPRRTKRNTLILTSLVLIASWMIVYLFLMYQFENSIEKQFYNLSQSSEKLFYLNIQEQEQSFELKLENIVSAKGLSEAVAKGDYSQLHAIVSPYYKRLKGGSKNVDILTFRSSEGITLYRAHMPEYYGDKVDERRTLISDTDKLQVSLHGFEAGKLEMTFRITKPIFYQDKYVGNVELGIDPTSYIKDFNAIFKIEIGVAIHKSLLSLMNNSDVAAINSDYVLVSGSKKLQEYFKENVDKRSALFKVKMDIPLKNHLSETLGYLVIGYDTSTLFQKDREFMFRLFAMLVLMVLVVGVILHLGFEKILLEFTNQLYRDNLTGLKNREALNRALFSKESHMLILSNIKEFSLINELYGVGIGNEVLIQAGKAFEDFASVYGCDTFHVSSDEYVLLKKSENFDTDYYNALLEDLYQTIRSFEIRVEGLDESISIEIYSGLAFGASHALEEAQMALIKAKSRSLPYLAYSSNIDTKERSGSIIQFKRTIRYALEHKNVVPCFQPITNKEGKIIKYEALIRIFEKEYGVDEFQGYYFSKPLDLINN